MRMECSNSLPTGRERRMPIGVEILAGLMALAGILFVIVGMSFFILRPKGIGTAWVGVGAAAGVILVAFGALHEVLAIGLMKLRDTARVLSILLLGLSAIGACLGLTATLVRFSYAALAWNFTVIAADAGALWYLLRSQVKEAFRG